MTAYAIIPYCQRINDARHYLDRKSLPPERVWRHTVYLWIYDLSVMYECLDRVYREDEEVYDERPLGQSAAACFVVDEEGRLDADSVVLSSAAWGLGRALATGRRSDAWFDDFARDADAFREAVAHLVGLHTEDPAATGRVITADILLRIGALTRQATGLPAKSLQAPAALTSPDPDGADPLPILRIARIQSRTVDPENEAPAGDFLNSFILDDLGRVIDAVRGGKASPALADYLAAAGGATPGYRRDTVADPAGALPHVGPGAIPYGRWPNGPHKSLATSQQLAVGLSLGDVTAADPASVRALRSVNGPPGTGKTTLLRDVFAGLVVERARQLAALPQAADGFTGEVLNWTKGDFMHRLHVPAPQLTGYEMVVASANNAAVQNVSDELPDAAAVDEPWSDAGYLRDIATRVRQVLTKDEGAQAWGMTAARLGKKENRRDFANAFWTNKREWGAEPRSFRHLLEEARNAEVTPWAAATGQFDRAVAGVDALVAEARSAQTRLDRRARIGDDVQRAERVLADIAAGEAGAVERLRRAEQENAAAAMAQDVAQAQLDEHRRQRPGWWSALVTCGEARRTWEADGAPLRVAAQAAETRRARAHAAVDDARARLTVARRDLAEAQGRRTDLLAEQRDLDRLCAADQERWGDAYPDAGWFHDVERREKTTPWSNAELNAARSEAFLAALDLHVEWFRHCAWQLIQSMRAAMDVVRGDVPRDLDPDKVRTAWQVFFLVVPLVSTTFASFGRMFSHLGAESLGWVFIDEAGQATPQSAAGALWRARHALVVGDPKQLTPIVTLPTKAEANIALQHGVPRLALPSQTSVQRIADETNPWGTATGSGDDTLWVGTPLRVHRRCDDPMFTISNEVAYGGMMIHGVPAGARKTSPLAPSAWLHVRAQGGNGHALSKDLAVVERLVRDLLAGAPDAGGEPVPGEEIIVISPFRAMANALARLPQRLGAPVRAGTVHTAQGQEADVVVFALGGDPARPGARAWAASTPNLVNVAASRAKKRLYVVGDHQAWAPLPHFTTVAGHLARRDASAEEVWGRQTL